MLHITKSSKPKKAKVPHIARRIVILVLTVVLCIADFWGARFVTSQEASSLITRFLGGYSVPSADAEDNEVDLMAREAATEIESEGAVLLSNNGALPFSSDIQKVNVFGWASVDWLGGGSGSGGVTNVKTDLVSALTDAGIEVNDELSRMYTSFQAAGSRPRTLSSTPEESSVLYEPAISDETLYTPELLSNARAFSDIAIVVIGRYGGESSDWPLSQYKVTQKNGKVEVDTTRTSLDLSAEEEALLAYVGATYEHVCVVINAANALNLSALKTTPGIDAALLVGYTGESAAEAIPDILWGNTNPSGRTVDTFAYDFASNPSFASSSEHVGIYTNAEGLYPADGTTHANLGLGANNAYNQVSYLDYSEGIYVGYRWYETADVEGYWASVSNEYGQGYEGVVQYPFGYGLSYTTFDWVVMDAPAQGTRLKDTTSFVVRVTNTGSVAGKDVVQLYYTAPYTAGQIEKSAVVLGAYAKTDLLQPGESQELTLTIDTRDMASYDYSDANGNGFVGYELDAGTYVFSLRHNAHEIDDDADAQISLNLARNRQFATDEKTGTEVSNKFSGDETTDGVSIDGAGTGQDITYLSRADFAGTFPQVAASRAMPASVAALNLTTTEDTEAYWSASDADTSMPTTGAHNGLAIENEGVVTELGSKLGSDYHAQEWESLLDQLTVSEMENLVTNAYSGTASLPSVGKESDAKDADGPSQIGGFIPINPGTGFPCSVVLAQTWNVELANKEGLLIGAQAAARGYSGWYAPATNIHRSPFNGRNYEYYSEDVLISGTMCGNVVSGARDAGIYCYVKHLVANDGEANIYRDGVYIWMSEQALREIYLEPFRTIVEDYHATGLMTSYSRLGAVWAGGSTALLTDVVRDEWGFEGTIITDYSDHVAYMNGDQALAAGGDLWMQFMSGSLNSCPESPSYVAALRRATKDVLYTYLDARVANDAYVATSGNAWADRPDSSALYTRVPRILAGILRLLGVLLVGLALRSLLIDVRLSAKLGAAEEPPEPGEN